MRQALILLALCPAIVAAQGWVVARAKPVEVCESSQREPVPTFGPNGFEYVIPPPRCRPVQTGKAPLYHINAGQLIPSQQTVPEGEPCVFERGRVVLDGIVYGRLAESALWAICVP